ncbi:hypothetical protein TcasGA2_TC009272 [Tribolium castaneum]|uniref:Uncharacterized protein n=1 Tax=Tribolium castaneum TaxID=7070 RepID=D6WSB2_TRICA|nr:hypothetical protein TcasGA2_TC009272 [Tribolium castaneum]
MEKVREPSIYNIPGLHSVEKQRPAERTSRKSYRLLLEENKIGLALYTHHIFLQTMPFV